MEKIIIVGSGASAVHFALSVLPKGYEVVMLDVGYQKPEIVNPENNFNELKDHLSDPVGYFLGKNFGTVLLPDDDKTFYGFPPNKKYVFKKIPGFYFKSDGFDPLFSFARGGLAEAWTAGVYPFNDCELDDFPFSYQELEPYYVEIARRIGISGIKDDLSRYYPFHEAVIDPLEMDPHSNFLLNAYDKHKKILNKRLGTYIGRSRVATLSRDKAGRTACDYSGRCQWGCPTQSLYTPSITLNECLKHPNFQYMPNMYVKHFEFNRHFIITTVVVEDIDTQTIYRFAPDKLVLAAGTLSSSKIFLESILKKTGKIVRLPGLMDNRQIWIPFVNLKMIGKPYVSEHYQYHQLVIGMESDREKEFVHGLITTLKTALIHPLIQNIPFDLQTSAFMFRNLRSGLGLVNVNFYDTRREENYLSLKIDNMDSNSILTIKYSPPKDEEMRIATCLKRLRKALWKLGCIAPSWMHETRPMGASVHYAGTLPMSNKKVPLTTSKFCQSHDFPNLYFADGTTFPYLPAKNLTLTLMANAVRIAHAVF